MIFSFFAAFFLGKLVGGRIFIALDNIVFVITILVTFFAAASWTFLSYLDGVLKDISAEKSFCNTDRYFDAIDRFGKLKAEIVHNVILIVVIFILERFSNGIFSLFYDQKLNVYQAIPNIAFSLRLAFFTVLIFALFNHLRGFVVALEYRNLIARYTRK